MSEVHNLLCSIEDVNGAEQEPELATNKEWRDEMYRARKAKGLTQEELADMVGAENQSQISRLESGAIGSSKLVLPICRVLEIQPPEHFADATSREYLRRMQLLHAHRPTLAKSLFDAIKAATDDLVERDADAPNDPSKAKK